LLCEAVDFAGEYVAAVIAGADDGLQLVDTLIDQYRRQLVDTDFRAGCPIVAVSVEAGEQQDAERMAPVVARAAAAFDRWNDLIAARLAADGVPRERASELAVLATTALEGAIVLARVRRDLMPLDVVHRQLRELLLATSSYQAAGKDPRNDR
jgi:hypothetical protein